MRISVIIPNYEDRRISRALGSVYAQTLRPHQVIVVDGGSRDRAVLDAYPRFPLDVLIREKDDGIFDAWNKGIARATGDLFCLIGSDDQLSDERVFERVAAAYERGPRQDGVCIGCEFITASGRLIRSWYPRRISSRRILVGLYPPHLSLFLSRELYELVGPFKSRMVRGAGCDTMWLLDMAVAKPDLRIRIVRDACLRMEQGGESTGSIRGIARQFMIVRSYARWKHAPFWYLNPWVKVASKLLQVRLPRREGSLPPLAARRRARASA